MVYKLEDPKNFEGRFLGKRFVQAKIRSLQDKDIKAQIRGIRENIGEFTIQRPDKIDNDYDRQLNQIGHEIRSRGQEFELLKTLSGSELSDELIEDDAGLFGFRNTLPEYGGREWEIYRSKKGRFILVISPRNAE